jgi:hypothetical protein
VVLATARPLDPQDESDGPLHVERPNPLPRPPLSDPALPPIELIGGTHPAILTAPHAEPHFREDYWKGRDTGSGELARLIAERTGARALILGAPAERDPNWYPGGAFKEALRALSAEQWGFLVDLHVMRDDWGYDALVGTGARRSALGEHALASLRANGLERVELRERGRFSGSGTSGSETIVRWAIDELSLEAIQIEIRFGLIGRMRDERLVRALETIVGWRP